MKGAASRTSRPARPRPISTAAIGSARTCMGRRLLALDAATGKLKWFFQTTHHDNWDYDLNSPPTLIDVKRNGRTIPAVAVYTKQGLLFVFDRVTGTPVFGVEERPVVSDNPLPGDEYSPTQPFPVKPPPIARMTFSPEEVAKVTPEHEAYCKGLLELEGGVMTGGPYAQYGPKLRVIFPGWTGGGNWNGSAFNPDLGYLFVPTQDHGMLNKMVKSTLFENMYVRSGPDNAPPMLGTNFWDGRKGWPCQQPPWGELVAVNANTGDIAWRVPLGSFEELDALGVPATGTLNRGGPIATAGGLVFIAASQDARFRAFDARTGKVLWVADLTENGRAVPITYQGKRGKQYVAIMAGGGRPVARKVDESRIGGRLHVFALAGRNSDARPGHGLTRENDVRLTRNVCCWCCLGGRVGDCTDVCAAAASARSGQAQRASPRHSHPLLPPTPIPPSALRAIEQIARTLQPHGHGAGIFQSERLRIQTTRSRVSQGIGPVLHDGRARRKVLSAAPSDRLRRAGNKCARARGALRRRVGQSCADVPASQGRRPSRSIAGQLVRRARRPPARRDANRFGETGLLGDEPGVRPAGASRLPARHRRGMHVVSQRVPAFARWGTASSARQVRQCQWKTISRPTSARCPRGLIASVATVPGRRMSMR